MMLSRRLLLAAAAGSAGLALTGCSGALPRTGSTGAVLASAVPLPRPFSVPLPVPLTARPTGIGGPNGAAYELVARAVDAEVLPGRSTRLMTYDGTFPGPTIRARAGEPAQITLRNELDVPTVLHLHGGRTPPEHDGYPTDAVLPTGTAHQDHGHAGSGPIAGSVATGSRTYSYPLEQAAAPLWYHDHTMDFTGPNVYAGLAGMFLLGSDEEDRLGLPSGERDVPLIICDRAFDQDAQLAYPLRHPDRSGPGVQDRFHGGVLGDCVLVNGAPWPLLEVDRARYRFRVLNASNARRYRLSLDGGGRFTQVGSDLGLLSRPVVRDAVTLAPAERVDVVVDFSEYAVGSRVTVRNSLGATGADRVLQFVVAREAGDDSRVPDTLARIEPIEASRVSVTRDLHFALGPSGGEHPHGLWSVNGLTFASGEDVARPMLGSVERWRISTDVHHPVHAHLLGFQVADAAGQPCWKDTVDVLPAAAIEVLVPIEGYRGRYVMHCHNLEHEDMMMMANFTVV